MHYAVVVMLELLCCIHAYRSGQERYWIFIIFCFPVIGCVALMNPLMILVKIIKLRWIHILSYDQMVSRKINNQTTR
ncbi:hypothetical protein MMN66_18105, partial [Escherichia coli]|nr:hypothetical protein [Escherichia coli]